MLVIVVVFCCGQWLFNWHSWLSLFVLWFGWVGLGCKTVIEFGLYDLPLKHKHPKKESIISMILFWYILLSYICISLSPQVGGGAVFSDQGEAGSNPTSLHPVGVANHPRPPTIGPDYPLLTNKISAWWKPRSCKFTRTWFFKPWSELLNCGVSNCQLSVTEWHRKHVVWSGITTQL